MTVVPPKVRVLDDTVVNQIAAGEVVERPASVVKELVENALDAGATEISVAIANGGKTAIEVVDNGSGMRREDALLAIERFGTSKITAATDLLSIQTLGFRGEALPSIASVSRFRLETRPRFGSSSAEETAEQGTEIEIEGGTLKQAKSKLLSPGTRISVRNLFFNIPARKSFLRSEATEEGAIRTLVLECALAYPRVSFRLLADGREVAHYPAGEILEERVRSLGLAGSKPLKVEYSGTLDRRASGRPRWLPETAGEATIHITGYLSQPIERARSANRLYLIVNGRVVRDRLLVGAIRDGYQGMLGEGGYPQGVLVVALPPEEVDVNVHPRKLEVRFRSADAVYRAINGAVRTAARTSSTSQSRLERFDIDSPPLAPPDAESRAATFIGSGRVWLGAAHMEPFAPNTPAALSTDALSESNPSPGIAPLIEGTAVRQPILSEYHPRELSSPTISEPIPTPEGYHATVLPYAKVGGEPSSQPRFAFRSALGESAPGSGVGTGPTFGSADTSAAAMPNVVGRGVSESPALDPLLHEQLKGARFVGQVFLCYLIFAGERSLLILDMHAAHERISFIKLREQFAAGKISSQSLLFPESVRLLPAEAARLRNLRPLVQSLGFVLSETPSPTPDIDSTSDVSGAHSAILSTAAGSSDTVYVHAIPAALSAANPTQLLVDIVCEPEWSDSTTVIDRYLDAVLARLACHSSIRKGRPLNEQEVWALVDQLIESDLTGFCPHGRPVIAALSDAAIEKLFGRQ